jgi:2-C-methyl-D-erythritol 4-phosphate cytidylyltransferase
MLSQTPEGFEFKTLLRAHELRIKYDPDFDYQDDVSVVYKFCGIPVEIVEGVYINSKITFGDDLIYSEAIMKVRHKPIKTEPNLEGKKILVFGGSGGIGSRVVELLKEKGAKVYAPTRQEVDLNQRLPDSLKDNWDGIVHCAGAYGTDDDFNYEEIMNVNFRSALDCLGLMTKGNIVFVGSTAGFYGRENITVYSASKAALNSLVESKAEELAQKGIYINCICPAKVATPLQERINPGTPKSEMMDPKQVAEIIIKYLDTKVYGQIIYLKVGKNF